MASGSSIWRRSPIPPSSCRRSPGWWGARAAGAGSLEALTTFLGERSVLLVVDNLEHCCPPRRTSTPCWRGTQAHGPGDESRAAAPAPGAPGRGPALAVPGAEPAAWTVANLAATPAVQLFVARAQAADATFELSPANAEAVAELSRRLEGLPLAVELAAAHPLLEPQALLARMHQSLALLRWEAPDLPPRHRSLHATLDWSYVLLTAHQQALFRRLAVFAGGFTLDEAEAVFTGDVPGRTRGQVTGSLPAPGAAARPRRAGRPGGAGRSRPRAAPRPDHGRAALPDAGDGAPVRAWSNWRRAAKRRRCGGGT